MAIKYNNFKLNLDSKIYVAGHNGMVGSTILRKLKEYGYKSIITNSKKQLNLLDALKTKKKIKECKPDLVILCASKVGGILANNEFPSEFLYENLTIQNNLIYSSFEANVKKLLFLGSSCIYPKFCKQPMKENMLLSGYLEPTNQSYAIAKIAGINLCDSLSKQYGVQYFSLMPCNLYGPRDKFNSKYSHVIPNLLSKFHKAKIENSKEVVVWGTGKPRREFLHTSDLADAIIHILNLDYNLLDCAFSEIGSMFINVGSGYDMTINELAKKIAKVTDYHHKICYDRSKPDGTPQKLLDISYIETLGWKPKISLDDGLKLTYQWYKENL